MLIQIRLEETGDATPGAVTTAMASVLNNGEVVESYHLDVVGDPAAWAVIEPESLSLLPGDERTASITFTVPEAALVPSGLVPWGLRARAESNPSVCEVEESALSIQGVSVLACELQPEAARGRRRSQHRAVVENRGNKAADVTVAGQDKDEVLDVRVENGRFTLPPGHGREVGIKVSSSDRGRGHHPFTVHVSEADGTTTVLRGALDQRPLPKAAWRIPIIAAAAVLAALMISGAQVAKSIRSSPDATSSATTASTTDRGTTGGTDTATDASMASVSGGPGASTPPEAAPGPATGAAPGQGPPPGPSPGPVPTSPPPPIPVPAVQGVLYAIDPGGTLFWYRHNDPAGGGPGVAGPTKLGQGGWGPYAKVFSGGEGVIYAIDAAGKMYWYRHQRWGGGQQGFDNGGAPKLISGGGWAPYTKVFSGGGGVIYAIDEGILYWYRHLDWAGGQGGFDNGGVRKQISIGVWAPYTSVLSGGAGRIYAIDSNGMLYWYRHIDWAGGQGGFDNGGVRKEIGRGVRGARWLVPPNQ